MTAASIANEEFKEGYVRYLYFSFFAAISILFIIFYFFPAFEFAPYTVEDKGEIIVIETIDYELPEPPGEIIQPVVPFETDNAAEAVPATSVGPSSFKDIRDLPRVRSVLGQQAEKFFPFDEKPVLIKAVSPVYPELSREAGIEGTVLLRVLISENGKVLSASVISSEVTNPLEKAAIAAVMRFRFKPARQRMKPVRAAVAIPIRFKLH